MSFQSLIQALKGGSGSGNFGHAGRPGKRGGSSAGGGRIIPPKFEYGPAILQNPTRKSQISGFLDTYTPNWYKSAFYNNPITGEMNVSSFQDHLPLAKNLVDHNHGGKIDHEQRNREATHIDESNVHGYFIRDRGQLTAVFRMDGAGLGKSEWEYSDRDKNTASKRIYALMGKLANMGFEGIDYVISSNDGAITGKL